MSGVYEALQRARQGGQSAIPLRSPQRPEPVRERPRPAVTSAPGPMAAELGSLLASVRPLVEGERGAVLHLVAATPGEGTSTIAREFALLAATAGQLYTLLVDANRSNLQTARGFACDTGHGLVELPLTDGDDGEIARPIPGTMLSVACLVAELSTSRADPGTIGGLYDRLRERFELVVVDCPAVGSGDYLELAPGAADGVILVVQAETTRPAVITHAKAQIEQAGGRVLGAVLNRRGDYIPDFLYRML